MRAPTLYLVLVLLAAPPDPPGVELTYLANMGVLVEGDGKRVVIDGFHRGELAEYAAVPPAILRPLEAAGDPFRRLDLVLTTHRHRDHFNAASVATRLRADENVVYLAAAETVDSLRARSGVAANHPRVHAVVTPPHRSVSLNVAGIAVDVLDLPHNPTPSQRVTNVGYLVTIGGMRILHVGDADPTAENYAPLRLSQRPVDVAFVPFWYLTNPSDAVRKLIGAKHWVATHVPPADAETVRRQVLSVMPDAIVLTTPGERHHWP